MPRRNAFDRLRQDPQQPISTIPRAQDNKRENRAWDKKHRGNSYFIPAHLHVQAKDMRAAVLALSQKHMTNTSSVASALMKYSLEHVRLGRLNFGTRPDAERTKMTLVWEDVRDSRPQEIPQPKKLMTKSEKELYINYRWGRDVDLQIKALAGTSIAPGEIVVFLLHYALAAYRNGTMRLKEETVVVSQKVTSTW
jgi:hypothetical protein